MAKHPVLATWVLRMRRKGLVILANSAQDQSRKAVLGASTSSAGMEELREMLFGNQMREQADRIDSMEKRFATESSKLRDELHTRLSNEMSSILSRLEQLEERVSSGMKDLRDGLLQQTQRIEDRITKAVARMDEEKVSKSHLAMSFRDIAEVIEASNGKSPGEECNDEQRS